MISVYLLLDYGITVWLYLFYRLSLQKIMCLFVICKAEIKILKNTIL